MAQWRRTAQGQSATSEYDRSESFGNWVCVHIFFEISPSPEKNKKSKNLNPNIDIFLKILRQK
jgi:hypothetical protein